SVTEPVTLPANGTEASLAVTMPAASFVTCNVQLDTAGDPTNGESFVTPVPSANQGKLDVYAVSSQRASLWSYGLQGTNCTLTKIAESKACAIQAVNGLPNSAVVIGDVSGDAGLEAVAMCTPAANAGFSFVVAPLVPAEANSLASSNLKLVMSPRARASTP